MKGWGGSLSRKRCSGTNVLFLSLLVVIENLGGRTHDGTKYKSVVLRVYDEATYTKLVY